MPPLSEYLIEKVVPESIDTDIKLKDAITDLDGYELLPCVRLFAAYHCEKGTINRNRDLKQQKLDWERIGKFLSVTR